MTTNGGKYWQILRQNKPRLPLLIKNWLTWNSIGQMGEKGGEAQIALKSAVASHSVTATLPREHLSIKPQIGFVIRYGRLYQWLRYDRFGHSEGLNTDEFVVVADENDHIQTRPKPFAGTPIKSADTQIIERRFLQFDPHDACLALAIWDDSFDVYQKVKAAAVQAGFEYRIILMREGSSLADRGGSDGRVE